MLRPTPQPKGAAAVSASIPPPVNGLNGRDSVADMDPADALVLDNFFPQGTSVELRRGFVSWATGGVPGAVETLLEYNADGGNELFACKGGDIYDVSTGGVVGAAVVTGLTNNRWQSVILSTGGGTFLVACNGEDAVQNYNGTVWATTPAITGVAPADLISVISHKRRLWFAEKDTSRAWYLAPNAIGGAANSLDLGAVWRMGGTLLAFATLSTDAGDGPDDFLAFISDRGEVAVYAGLDPATASTWSLVGVFRIGSPIGRRCVMRSSGDALVVTEDGVISLQQAMQVDRSATQLVNITDKIRTLFASASRSYRNKFGWQPVVYPSGNWGLFNIPTSTTKAFQYVVNTTTGAWCRFVGMNALCWSLRGEDIYFGTADGRVFKADTGRSDAGTLIQGDIKTAFNYFGSKAGVKHFTLIRPAFTSTGRPSPSIVLNVDFKDVLPTATSSFGSSGAKWDVAKWDRAQWVGAGETQLAWVSVYGIGRCAAVRLRVRTDSARVSLQSLDLIYTPATGTAL